MAKFRSWNEKFNIFTYFIDGYYTDSVTEKDIFYDNKTESDVNIIGFNWQNAEQEFERYNIKFFVGDKFKINDCIYGVVAIRNGILGFDKYETCCDSYIEFLRITDYNISKLEKIGNIHEL